MWRRNLGSGQSKDDDDLEIVPTKVQKFKTQKSAQVEGVVQALKAANTKTKPKGGLTSCVLQRETENLKDLYTLGRKLGQGQFGITYLCVEKATGKEYACKTIAKKKLVTHDDVADVRRELQIMHHLSGNSTLQTLWGGVHSLYSY